MTIKVPILTPWRQDHLVLQGGIPFEKSWQPVCLPTIYLTQMFYTYLLHVHNHHVPCHDVVSKYLLASVMIEVKVKVKVITTCISIIGWNMEEA